MNTDQNNSSNYPKDLNSIPIRQLIDKQFEELFLKHPHQSPDAVFLIEASKMHQSVITQLHQVQRTKQEISDLRRRLGLEGDKYYNPNSNNSQVSENDHNDKKRRARRTAVEIARHYICNIDKCSKSYGSQGSLNQHIKIKHKHHYLQYILMMDSCQGGSQVQ